MSDNIQLALAVYVVFHACMGASYILFKLFSLDITKEVKKAYKERLCVSLTPKFDVLIMVLLVGLSCLLAGPYTFIHDYKNGVL